MKHRFANIFRGNGYGLAAVESVTERLLMASEIDCLICALYGVRNAGDSPCFYFCRSDAGNKPGHMPPVLHLPTVCYACVPLLWPTVRCRCRPGSMCTGQGC